MQVKKAEIIRKATKFSTCDLMDSTVHHQMYNPGMVIIEVGKKFWMNIVV
jgi:hypothetical protein